MSVSRQEWQVLSAQRDVIFLGSVVPDTEQYRTAAFSRAGNLAQLGLLQGLQEAGVSLRHVVAFQATPTFPRSRAWWVEPQCLVMSGVPTSLVCYLNLPGFKPLALAAALLRRLEKVGARECVVVSYNFNVFLALPMAVARWRGARVVPVLFDVDIPGHTVANTWARRLDLRLTKWLLRSVDAAVVITPDIARDFLVGQPSVVVEGGLNTLQQQYGTSEVERSSQRDTFDMVVAGALELHNGIDVVLDALALVKAPEMRLHVAGRGSLEEAVRERAIQDPRIVFHGYLDAAGVAALYRGASLLINHRSDVRINSRYVFPSKLIEYLATGIPVVSTLFRSLGREYRPFLTLTQDESPEALAAAILEISSNPAAAWQRAEDARNFVMAEKTWHMQGRRIARLLEVGL